MKVLESLQHCVLRSAFSFLEPESYPPSTLEQWRGQCKAQSEAFRCVKDNSKAAPALIKRGMSSLVSYRQRHQRKYCTNLNSEATKKFVAATKCIVDKRLDTYRKLDSDYMSKLRAIKLANFNDAAPELQHMCCATLKWRKVSMRGPGVVGPARRASSV